MLYGKYRKLVGKQEEGINAEKFLCMHIDFCTNRDKKTESMYHTELMEFAGQIDRGSV